MKINRDKFNYLILTSLFYVSLFRSTNIGFGYPTAEHLLGSISYGPQKLMQVYIALFLFIFFVLSNKQINKKSHPSKLSILIVVSCFISLVSSPYIMLTARFILSFLVSTLSLYLYYVYYGPTKVIASIIKFIKIMFVINFIYVLVFPQYGIMTAVHSGAWRGMFVHKNGCGPFYALCSVFFLNSWWFSKYKCDLESLFFLLLGFFMVIKSNSATAVVTLIFVIFSFLFFLILSTRKNKNEKIFILIFYIGIISILSITINLFLNDIFDLLGKDPTLTGRTGLWNVLFELSYKRPFFGYGLGLFSRPEIMYQYSTEFGWDAKSAHSSYIDLILGVGYIGSISVFIWLFSHVFQSVIQVVKSKEYQHLIAAALSVIFGSLVIGGASSGVLLTGSITWLLIVSMVLFLKSEEL